MLYAQIAIALALILGLGVLVLIGIQLLEVVSEGLERIAGAAGTAPEPAPRAEIAELERQLGIFRRELADIDEKSEERFRRIQARRRRDEKTVEVPDELAQEFDPAQLQFPGGGWSPPENGQARPPALLPTPKRRR